MCIGSEIIMDLDGHLFIRVDILTMFALLRGKFYWEWSSLRPEEPGSNVIHVKTN